jgi:cellulose synthase operon protein C
VRRLQATVESAIHTGSPTALPLLYQLRDEAQALAMPQSFESALRAALKSPESSPLLQTHAHLMAASLDSASGDPKATERHWRSAGVPEIVWIRSAAVDRLGKPGDCPQPSIFPDASRLEPRWVALRPQLPDGSFVLSGEGSQNSSRGHWIHLSLRVPKDVQVVLRVGFRGEFSAAFSGRCLGTWRNDLPPVPDQHAIPLSLAAGVNLVFLHYAGLDDGSRIFLQLTMPEGGCISGLLTRSEEPPGAMPAEIRTADSNARASFETPLSNLGRLLREDKNLRLPNRADLLEIYASGIARFGALDAADSDPKDPSLILEEGMRFAPNRPSLGVGLAKAMHQRDPARSEAVLQRALRSDPRYVPAVYELARAEEHRGLAWAALEGYDRALRQDPRYLPASLARSQLLFSLDSEAPLAIHTLEKAEGVSDSAEAVSELARMHYELGNSSRARTLAEQLLARDPAQSVARYLLTRLDIDRGDLEAALNLTDQGLLLKPSNAQLHRRKAGLLKIRFSSERAIEYLRTTEHAFPEIEELSVLQAEYLAQSGKDTEAGKLLFAASARHPQDRSLKRQWRWLLNMRDGLRSPSSAVDTLRSLPVTEDELSSGGAILRESITHRLVSPTYATQTVERVIRLSKTMDSGEIPALRISYTPSRESVDILSSVRITPTGEHHPDFQTTHEDAPKLEDLYLDEASVVVEAPNLQAGDLVHLRYRVDSFLSPALEAAYGQMYGISKTFPTYQGTFRVVAPQGTFIAPMSLGTPPPKTFERKGRSIYLWQYGLTPSLQLERFAPAPIEQGPVVGFSRFASWKALSEWYSGLLKTQLALDPEAIQIANRFRQAAPDHRSLIASLFDYVRDRTRYVGIELGIHGYQPYPAAEVHTRGYGDCKDTGNLLVAMLEAAGVRAGLVLIRTRDHGPFPKGHPSVWAFNHAVVYVPSVDLFLDPTNPYTDFNTLPELVQGTLALILYGDGEHRLTTTPASQASANQTFGRYALRSSTHGELFVDGDEHFRGILATEMRSRLQDPKARTETLRELYAEAFPDLDVQNIQVTGLTERRHGLRVRFRGKTRWPSSAAAENIRLSRAPFRHHLVPGYAASINRHSDLVLPYRWRSKNEIRLRLSGNLKPDPLPNTERAAGEFLQFENRVRLEGDTLVLWDEVALLDDRIPQGAYTTFRNMARRIDGVQSQQLILHVR